VSHEVDIAFSWVVEALQQDSLPRTILYCTSISDCSKIYTYLVKELPDCSDKIEMYHSETPDHNKEKIISELQNSASKLNLVICTNALGMGIDIKNCSSVVLYGAPKHIVDVVQEIGRVGRDGSQSTALLLYNSYHVRHVDEDVKQFYKTSNCKREMLMSFFLSKEELTKIQPKGHLCCDFCEEKCNCGSCSKTPLETVFIGIENDSDSEHDEFDSDDDVVLLEAEFDEM
jgi:ATP-dependent DNA helicase RecQ